MNTVKLGIFVLFLFISQVSFAGAVDFNNLINENEVKASELTKNIHSQVQLENPALREVGVIVIEESK